MALIGRIRTVWTGVATGPAYNSLYFTGITDSASAQTAINAVDAFWTGLAGVICTGGTAVIEGDVTILEDSTGEAQSVISATPGAVTSSASGDRLPPANQGLIRCPTPDFVGGRQVVGRVFVPAPSETDSTNGLPTTLYQNALATHANTLSGMAAPVWVIWSRPREATDTLPFRAGSSHAVLTCAGAPFWAVLRSRRD